MLHSMSSRGLQQQHSENPDVQEEEKENQERRPADQESAPTLADGTIVDKRLENERVQ